MKRSAILMLNDTLQVRPTLTRNVPSTWDMRRFKYVAQSVVEKPETIDQDLPYIGMEHVESWTGRVVSQPDEMEDSTSNVCQPGDVLFGKLRPYLAKVFTPSQRLKCSSEFLVLRSSSCLPAYLKYLLLSREFVDLVNSSTYGAKMPRASWDFIGDIRVPVPPIHVQENIASFLDHQTAKLDQLIEKKRRLIELLQEHRQALITQVVTKGLDPNVPMKDSGIPWIGEVPAHWAVMKMTHIFGGIGSGTTPDSNESEYYDGDIPWVITGDLNDDELWETSKHVTASALARYTSLKLYPPGTLLVAMYGATIGKLAILRILATTNQACCALYNPRNVDTKFVFYWFMAHRRHIVSFGVGGGQPNISQEIIRNLRVAVPPLDEQKRILGYIESSTTNIGRAIRKLESQIQLILEYRQAFISFAVTGQIDVRQWSPGEVGVAPP